jgi:stage IV sporulation protein FB
MYSRQNPLYWSFAAGTWSGVHLRISWMMPLLLAVLLYKFQFKLGGALFGVLFVSVLLHEIGHILAARATDGSGDEILMWPLGGLAFVETSTPRSQAITAAAGPLVNLVLCTLSAPVFYKYGSVTHALNPLVIPIAPEDFGRSLVSDLQLLTFWFNWVSLLVNLIPAYPLDGGQIARCVLTSRLGMGMGTEVAIRVAIGIAVVLGFVDLVFFENLVLLTLAFFIIVLAVQENHQLQASESYDDSFMGYDFSQGYTSLERSEPAGKPKRPAGLLARWLARRRAGKQQRLQEQAQQTERQLDAILAKVHDQGLTSLTLAEKRLLKRASNRFRSKDAGSE